MCTVAMIARSTLYKVKGGDTIQIMATARHLRALGIAVDIKLTSDAIDYKRYDLLHFFNIIRPSDILYHIKKSHKPFVLSPILVDYHEFDKYHRNGLAGKIFYFLPAGNIEYLKTIARWLLGKDRLMSYDYLWLGQKRAIVKILQKTRMLLPNSASEYKRLARQYPVAGDYTTIVNGIDSNLFQFDKEVEKDPLLVICVARVEGIKNQLNLIRALNNTNFQLVIIGSTAPNQQSYYEACKNIGADNISFMQHVPQEELCTWYQQAKVHVLPSWFETTGLSSLEAGAMGCNLVITEKGDTKSYFGEHAFYCDPSSPQSIFEAIEKAAAKPIDELLRKKILANYTWQQAALQTLSAYKKVYD
jgi:glycosyltransferase involved in cell wall biosynthesis